MSQNNIAIITLMIAFQLVNFGILFGKRGHEWRQRTSGVLFLALPTFVILSLLWRPL